MIESHAIDQALDQDGVQDQGTVEAERIVIDPVQDPETVNALPVIVQDQEIGKSVEDQGAATKKEAREVAVEVKKGMLEKKNE